MTSPDFWATLRALAGKPESAALVFGILERGTTGTPPAIMADNYEAAIALLNDFATAANPYKVPKQRADPRGHKVNQSKQTKKQYVPRDLWCEYQELITDRNAETVARGVKAVTILYNMTARIPQLMQQSQLESSEGASNNRQVAILIDVVLTLASLVRILVTNLPSSDNAMHKPMSGSAPNGIVCFAKITSFTGADLHRPERMDCHFQQGLVSSDHQTSEARGFLN